MKPSTTQTSTPSPADKEPNPSAHVVFTSADGKREVHSVVVNSEDASGTTKGAAIGVTTTNPAGVKVTASAGAVVRTTGNATAAVSVSTKV